MERLKNYFVAFIITTIFFILLGRFYFIDTLVVASFIISTLLFLFTQEANPKNEEHLFVPKVHYYHRSHINIYGYIMAIAGVSTAFMFYVSTMYSLRLALMSVILWSILLVVSYFANKYAGKRIYTDAIIDYVLMFQTTGIAYKRLHIVIREMVNSENYDTSILKKIIHSVENKYGEDGLNDSQENELINLYLMYVEETSISEQELVSDEIKELNKEKTK